MRTLKSFCFIVGKASGVICLGLIVASLLMCWGASPAVAQYRARLVDVPSQAQPGEFVRFGRYAQGETGEVAPVEWVMLDKSAHAALLLAVKSLDCRSYNEAATNTSWSKCSLRRWLNQDFVAQTFSPTEQALLLNITAHNTPNSRYGTLAGEDTEDRVSLLSPEQVEYYIYSPSDRVCQITPYGVRRGAFVVENNVCWWWLRAPGSTAQAAACVTCDGSLVMEGAPVNRADGGVRPLIRIMI